MARHEHIRSLEAALLGVPGQACGVAEKLLRMGNVPGRNQLCSKRLREIEINPWRSNKLEKPRKTEKRN
jgi:hypothetical protein